MKFEGTKTDVSRVNVEINPLDALETLKCEAYRAVKIPTDTYYNSKLKKLSWDEEMHTSHYYTIEHEIKNPTLEQVELVRAFETIKKHLRDLKI